MNRMNLQKENLLENKAILSLIERSKKQPENKIPRVLFLPHTMLEVQEYYYAYGYWHNHADSHTDWEDWRDAPHQHSRHQDSHNDWNDQKED